MVLPICDAILSFGQFGCPIERYSAFKRVAGAQACRCAGLRAFAEQASNYFATEGNDEVGIA